MAQPLSPLDPPRAQVQQAETPGISELLTLVVAVVVVSGLYLARDILVPLTLAVLLSFLLAPLVGLLRRLHLGRVPSILLAVIVALGVILSLGTVMGTQVAELATNIPRYADTIHQKIATVQSFTVGRVSNYIGAIGRQLGEGAAPAAPQQTSQHADKPLSVQMTEPTPTAMVLAQRYLSPVLSPLATTGIVFIVAIFILLQQEDLRDRLIRLFGSNDLHRATAAIDDGARRLSRYFLFQLALNASFGVVITVGLLFIGVPNPVLWGILSALLRFVPYIGSLLGGLLPVGLAAAVDPGWSMTVWTIALFLVAEPVMGQVVEPIVYGRSTGMSPIAVVVAAIFWSWLWGPVGLILSTPLTLCLVVLGRHVQRFEFLEVLLGDRPPLTPVVSFYQRLLMADGDELLEQAEAQMKELSVAQYYDRIGIEGLRLAAQDVERGALQGVRLERVRKTLAELVAELGDLGESPPPEAPAAAAARSVLCIAGRGPFDDVAATMLAQALQRDGVQAGAVEQAAVSRTSITQLPNVGIGMICAVYLELDSNRSHVRFLLRRLQQRFPGVPVAVGLYAPDDPAWRDERSRPPIGAEHYASSICQMVKLCVERDTPEAAAA